YILLYRALRMVGTVIETGEAGTGAAEHGLEPRPYRTQFIGADEPQRHPGLITDDDQWQAEPTQPRQPVAGAGGKLHKIRVDVVGYVPQYRAILVQKNGRPTSGRGRIMAGQSTLAGACNFLHAGSPIWADT